MTAYPVGIAVNTHAASGSVTGTWGVGQSRAAGHLLVAAVSCAATTSVTATGGTAGWTNLFEVPNSGTANVRVAVWVKTAAGADAAPTFTTTVTGTGAMDCMLFDLAGAAVVSPVDTSGTYASGAAAGTLSLMTATTATAPAVQGELAISVFAQEAAAASLTWTDASLGVSGFTKLLNGNGVSSVLQTYIGIVNPVTSTQTVDSGAFSTDTSAFGAGLVVVFSCNLPELEVFADNAAATVTAGGTSGPPASGTAESWTVNATAGFPAAVPNATQFHVIDPALPSEKILVTVAPGGPGSSQAWTVTRGAEGTAPVVHQGGFAIVQSVTAGVLTVLQRPGEYSVKDYGATGNGATDDAPALNALIASAPLGSKVIFPFGTYGVGSTLQLPGGLTYEGMNKDFCVIQALPGANLDAVAATVGWTDSINIYAVAPTTIYGLQFSGQPAQSSGAGHGLVLQTYRARVRDCIFFNCKGDGLRLDQLGLNGTTAIGNAMEENKTWDCQFDTCSGSGFHVNDPTTSTITDGFLLNSICRYCASGPGVYIQTGAGWVIDGNHVYNSGFSAFRVDRAFQTRIVNNYAEAWATSATAGTYGGIDCASGFVADLGNGSCIANNVMRVASLPGNAATFVDGISFAVSTGQAGNVSVIGNNLYTAVASSGHLNGINLSCQGAGSVLTAAITGNLIRGTTWDNVVLQNAGAGSIGVITES